MPNITTWIRRDVDGKLRDYGVKGPAAMLAKLRPLLEEGRTKRDLAAITTQLDLCSTPCKEFNGQTCTRRGSACKKWQRWEEFLALTDGACRYFEPSPEQPIRPA